jgi:hypothetical protein
LMVFSGTNVIYQGLGASCPLLCQFSDCHITTLEV